MVLDDGSHLQYAPPDPKRYFQKMNILYGETDSGKTVVMLEAMKILQPYIPLWFIICPTNNSNNAYTDRIPGCCIKHEVDVTFLEALYKRQEYIMEIYRKVNKLPVLESLFMKSTDPKTLRLVKRIKLNAARKIKRITGDASLETSMKKAHIKAINKTLEEYLVSIYKTIIRFNRDQFSRVKLTGDESVALKFLDLNPNIGLIFDDIGAEIDKHSRNETIKKFFYQGRHEFATVFFLFQNTSDFKPGLRRNVRTNIFTTAESATGFFDTRTNANTKQTMERARMAIKACFEQAPGSNVKHFRKLVYQKGKADGFAYMVADNYEDDDFRCGCQALWEFSSRLPLRSKKETASANPFLSKYVFD